MSVVYSSKTKAKKIQLVDVGIEARDCCLLESVSVNALSECLFLLLFVLLEKDEFGLCINF